MLLKKFNNGLMEDFVIDFFGRNDFNSNVIRNNIKELNESFELELVLPGFKKDDININIEDSILTVSSNIETKNEEYSRQEYYKSSFEKKYSLPKNVSKDDIGAKMVDGILTITLNKIKENKVVKTIEII